jgi:hypothetical protein
LERNTEVWLMAISWYYHADDHRETRQETRRVPKSAVIRALIDRAGPIDTGDDLIEWVDASAGKGLGLAQKTRKNA